MMHHQSSSATNRAAELLLIEDNRGDVLLMLEALKTAKLANRVSVARDGAEALRMLRKEAPYPDQATPDLILLDLNLPGKDGRDILKEIKSNPATSFIPVIVFSSSSAERDVMESYALNANCYVVKPLNFQGLKDIVSSLETFWLAIVPRLSGGEGQTHAH
jgi:CheY-like chemotaxis protein